MEDLLDTLHVARIDKSELSEERLQPGGGLNLLEGLVREVFEEGPEDEVVHESLEFFGFSLDHEQAVEDIHEVEVEVAEKDIGGVDDVRVVLPILVETSSQDGAHVARAEEVFRADELVVPD